MSDEAHVRKRGPFDPVVQCDLCGRETLFDGHAPGCPYTRPSRVDGLKARVAELERERDEARTERDTARRQLDAIDRLLGNADVLSLPIDAVQALLRERDEQRALATEALVGNVKLRGACERLRDEQAQAEAQAAAMRRALERLRSAATDSANIREHDGWHRTDPYIEMPRELLAEVDAALEVDAGRALVARLERYEQALAQIEVLDPALTQHAACARIACAALDDEGGRDGRD